MKKKEVDVRTYTNILKQYIEETDMDNLKHIFDNIFGTLSEYDVAR